MRIRLVLMLSVLAGAQVASAEPTPPSAPPVVTLPTLLSGINANRDGWLRLLDAHLESGVRRGRRAPRLPGPLTDVELSCREAECMARVAESNEGAQVLGVKVTADRGSPPSYEIVIVRYDRERPGTVRAEQESCSVCTRDEVAERVEQMVIRVLPVPEAPAAPAPPPQAVAPPVPERPAVPPRRGPSRKTLFALVGVTAALGVGGIAMLGAGGYGLAINGHQTTPAVSPHEYAPEVYDTRGQGAGLLAAGSVVTVGALIGLGFEIAALLKN